MFLSGKAFDGDAIIINWATHIMVATTRTIQNCGDRLAKIKFTKRDKSPVLKSSTGQRAEKRCNIRKVRYEM